jgi:hypothetical protein
MSNGGQDGGNDSQCRQMRMVVRADEHTGKMTATVRKGQWGQGK